MKLAPPIGVVLAGLSITLDLFAARVRFVSEAGDTFDRRITAEIESVGFEVERPASREAPLREDTVAIVAVGGQPPSVEVWLVDAQGKATLSTVIARDPEADTDTDGTRVAERLRALLQPLAEREERARGPLPVPPPPRNEPDPSPAAAAEPAPPQSPVALPRLDRGANAERPPSSFGVDAAGAVLGQPGGAAASVLVRARYEALPPFGVSLFVALPITKTRVRDADASADLDVRLAGAGAHIHVLPVSSDWRLRIGAGCAVGWLTAIGDADAPRRGRNESAFTALPFASVDVARRLTRAVSVTAGTLAGVALPRADVELGGEHVGSWGRPLLMAQLGLGYDP